MVPDAGAGERSAEAAACANIRVPMRILVHDFGGYPFIVQLSRELAGRGHRVLHLNASGFRQPKGPMERQPDDAPTLAIEPLTLDEPLRRDGAARVAQERRYRSLLSRRIETWRPEVVLSANSPLEVQAAAIRQADAGGAAFVFWLQDLHSVAISRHLGRRYPVLGSLIGARFTRLEQRLLRQADAVVAISADYLDVLRRWKLPMEHVEVIENWAPLEDRPPRTNAWAAAQGLGSGYVVLYAGTLALKHNPALLLELARGLPDASVVVAAEGPGADWLRERSAGAPNLRILSLQPYEQVPAMLASADLLVAILEPDASTFSAPSKVLTYLAAGRTIVAAIPAENAAARLIKQIGAGTAVEPDDTAGLVFAAESLLADPQRLAAAGYAGRAYAEQAFAIGPIADQFERTLARAMGRKLGAGAVLSADTGRTKDASHETST